MTKRKLGNKINRGFMIVVIILCVVIAIRFTIAVIKYDTEHIEAYPETQDNFGETAHGLGISRELVDSTVNTAYVDGFFK